MFRAKYGGYRKPFDIPKEIVEKTASEGGGLSFPILAREAHWFTIPGLVLSDEDMLKYTKGDYTFYFAGQVLVKRTGVTKPLRICAFVIGSNPNSIVNCPASAEHN